MKKMKCCEYGPRTVKHYGFVIYGKWTHYIVSYSFLIFSVDLTCGQCYKTFYPRVDSGLTRKHLLKLEMLARDKLQLIMKSFNLRPWKSLLILAPAWSTTLAYFRIRTLESSVSLYYQKWDLIRRTPFVNLISVS
jgi:hypothetical protein